jgi:hypothetical protein
MRLFSTLAAALLVSTCSVFAGDEAPQVTGMSPKTAKAGEVLAVTGISLGSNKIDEVYLTDHKFDMRVKVVEQKADLIRFRIPPFAKPGRMQLLLLTKGENPMLLEQPAYVVIEDSATEVGQAAPAAGPSSNKN